MHDNDYDTVTTRSFELGYFMGRFDRRYTIREMAEAFNLSFSGAYRLVRRCARTQMVRVCRDADGRWHAIGNEE